MKLAVGDRGRAFKAVSPGMLPPLAIVFTLLVGFLAAQAWSDVDRAHSAVNREASALRAVVRWGRAARRNRRPSASVDPTHIKDTIETEWPAMGRRSVTLSLAPASLAEALRLSLALERMLPELLARISARRHKRRELAIRHLVAIDLERSEGHAGNRLDIAEHPQLHL